MPVELEPSVIWRTPLVKCRHGLSAAELHAEWHGGTDEDDAADARGLLGGQHHRALGCHRPATRMALSVPLRRAPPGRRRRTPFQRMRRRRLAGRTGRCHDHRRSPRGNVARDRESASSSSASERSTTEEAGGWSARRCHTPRRRCGRRRARRIPRSRDSAPGSAPGALPYRQCLQGQGLASYTMLKGVSAARRKRVKPPALTTSRIRASPACAPSASPTSCDSEAGVQRSVEKL